MSTASQLTESELRSLRAIRCPEWWQREALSAPQSPIPTASSQQSTLLLRFWRRFFDTHRPPILEGKTVYRHYLNPKAIVAVGKSQSFVHLPGVKTRVPRNFPSRKFSDTKISPSPTVVDIACSSWVHSSSESGKTSKFGSPILSTSILRSAQLYALVSSD